MNTDNFVYERRGNVFYVEEAAEGESVSFRIDRRNAVSLAGIEGNLYLMQVLSTTPDLKVQWSESRNNNEPNERLFFF